MSGVKNIIQQNSKGLKVPTNQEYRTVGTKRIEPVITISQPVTKKSR